MKTKPEYFYRQSGIIPIKIKKGKVNVLLITSRKKKKWIIPKGIIEPGLSHLESAVKETLEEAGVKGKVIQNKIGRYSYKKWGDTCTVSVFLMNVTTEQKKWDEDFRDRVWVPIDEISNYIEQPGLLKLMKKAGSVVKEYKWM